MTLREFFAMSSAIRPDRPARRAKRSAAEIVRASPHLMGELRREAGRNPAAATLLEEIEAADLQAELDAEEAARRDLFTGAVKNSSADGVTSYLPGDGIYSPVHRVTGL